MEKQLSFSDCEYAGKKRQTKREAFLSKMELLIPWKEWVSLIEPFYPSGERGRPPIGCERMLRMLLVQGWYNLSDEALEDTIYDSQSLRLFIGINLGSEDVPDATTLLKFRHLLQEHQLQKKMFTELNILLKQSGILMKEGSIVDATIIESANSTKNKEHQRDPKMHQVKKGNEWHFGMKAHIGVDAFSGLVHTLVTTAANVSDISQTTEVLHGEEDFVYADAGYIGIEKREEAQQKFPAVNWLVAKRRGSILKMADGLEKEAVIAEEYAKAAVRSLVEHPFHFIKNLFGYRKTRYRGLVKNESRLYLIFASANLLIAKRKFDFSPS